MSKFALLISVLFCTHLFGTKQAVTIHGFLRAPWMMNKVVRLLKEDGYEVDNWDYKSRRKRIEGHAIDLVSHLNEMAKGHPGEPIDFVTHSLGGIIVRAALNHPDCPSEAKIGKAVLMGPPNQGAQLGRNMAKVPIFRRWAGYKAGADLMETSDKGFAYLGEFPETMKVMVLAGTVGVNPFLKGPSDSVVRTDETRLNTPHEYHEVKAMHTWITFNNEALKLTREFLN